MPNILARVLQKAEPEAKITGLILDMEGAKGGSNDDEMGGGARELKTDVKRGCVQHLSLSHEPQRETVQLNQQVWPLTT